MHRKRRLILPVIGLAYFALVTWGSLRWNKEHENCTHNYFYWSCVNLNTDPLKLHPENSDCWIWLDCDAISEAFLVTVLPIFLIAKVVFRTLARFGVSELTTFMVVMPPLIFLWYYFIAWAFDRLLSRLRRLRPETGQQI